MISIERAIDPQTEERFCCVFDTETCLPIEPIQRYLNYCRKRQLAANEEISQLKRQNEILRGHVAEIYEIRDENERLRTQLKELISSNWLVMWLTITSN